MKLPRKESKQRPFSYHSIRQRWSIKHRKKQAPAAFSKDGLSRDQLSSMSSLADYAEHTFHLQLEDKHIHDLLAANAWDLKHAMIELDHYEEAYHGLLHTTPEPGSSMLGAENDGGTSCYIDALLFAMFISLMAFDPLLTYDTSSDQPEKATLQTALRLFVNTMRKGQLVRRHVVVQLREALQSAGWNGKSERGSWRQEDASELLLFLTEAFDLPYLPFQMRLFHGAKKDVDDDRVTTDRVLSLSMPMDSHEQVIRLENILLDHFYSSIVTGVRRQVDWHEFSSNSAPASPTSMTSMSSIAKVKLTERREEIAVNAWQVLELLPFYSGINEQGEQIKSQNRGSFPDSRMVLPIILKRYRCSNRGTYTKDQRRVLVPASIHFNRFLNQNADDPLCDTCGQKIEGVMRLRSAVCHKGHAPFSGHYIAYSRSFKDGQDYWLKHDDLSISERVKPLRPQDEKAIYEELSRDGYLFFYELYRECKHHHETPTSTQEPSRRPSTSKDPKGPDPPLSPVLVASAPVQENEQVEDTVAPSSSTKSRHSFLRRKHASCHIM